MRANGFVLGLICSPVVLLLYWWVTTTTESESPAAQTAITLADLNYAPTTPRKAIPDVPFQGAEGQAINLKMSLGKPVILHFWAPWCGACVMEMPDLELFAKQHGKEIAIICVASDHTGGSASRNYYKNNNIEQLSLNIDQHQGNTDRLGNALAVYAFPTTVLISAQGEEIGRIMGPIDWQGEAGKLLLKLLV